LPDGWVSPMPSASGFVWDVAGPPNPENGHCVAGFGYSNEGITISTWGMTGCLTYKAVAKYATRSAHGALYTVISEDGIDKATDKAPNGFDWTQLVADFDSMGGSATGIASTWAEKMRKHRRR
jgi:hypothetical protein